MADTKEIRIKLNWDRQNTIFFISTLLTKVNRKQIEFDFQVKKGSIPSEFIIIAGGFVVGSLTTSLIWYLETRRRAMKQKGKFLPEPEVSEGALKIDYSKEIKNMDFSNEYLLRQSIRESVKNIPKIGSEFDTIIKQATKEKLGAYSRSIQEELKRR